MACPHGMRTMTRTTTQLYLAIDTIFSMTRPSVKVHVHNIPNALAYNEVQ